MKLFKQGSNLEKRKWYSLLELFVVICSVNPALCDW